MRYAYYPGCCLHTTCKELDVSLRAVGRRLGLELEEIRGWVCCGASAVHATSRHLAAALPLWNLAQVERQGLREVLVPCAACFSRFKFAWRELEQQPQLRRELEDIVEHKFGDGAHTLHPLELFSSEPMLGQAASLGRGGLSGLKVVCYYGCLLTRPPEVARFDDCEYPQSMDRLLRALGATVLDWGYRTDCCGASLSVTKTNIGLKLSHEILEGAREVGAQAISVSCAICYLNLDSRQYEIEEMYGTRYNLPVFYFTELMAIALGVHKKELMLERHMVDVARALEKVAA